MSLESWKKEFYPVEASDKHTDIEAIEHAIQKWSGYSKANLRKHELTSDGLSSILSEIEQSEFAFSTDTCSLCLKYFSTGCEKCPLFLIGESCLSLHHPIDNISPYRKTTDSGNPSYILEALKKALIYSKENS